MGRGVARERPGPYDRYLGGLWDIGEGAGGSGTAEAAGLAAGAPADRGEQENPVSPPTPRLRRTIKKYCSAHRESEDDLVAWLRQRQIPSLFALEILADEVNDASLLEEGEYVPPQAFLAFAQEQAAGLICYMFRVLHLVVAIRACMATRWPRDGAVHLPSPFPPSPLPAISPSLPSPFSTPCPLPPSTPFLPPPPCPLPSLGEGEEGMGRRGGGEGGEGGGG